METLGQHFFYGDCCKCSWKYLCSWIFIILGYCFIISWVITNPSQLDFGKSPNIIKGLLILGGVVFVTIFGRCMCWNKLYPWDRKEEDRHVNWEDIHFYNEDTS